MTSNSVSTPGRLWLRCAVVGSLLVSSYWTAKSFADEEARVEIGAKLAAVPRLRDLVLRMIADPSVPAKLKKVVFDALIVRGAVVEPFTQRRRRQYGMTDSKYEGLQVSGKTVFHVFYPADPAVKTVDQAVSERLYDEAHDEEEAAELVLVQQRPITKSENDFLMLMHELAHVQFEAVVATRLSRMIQLGPDLVRIAGDGRLEINGQLYDFLNERYAVEIEFETLRATFGTLFDVWSSERFDDSMREAGYDYRQEIADGVATGYRITDPKIVRMKDVPIARLLDGDAGTALAGERGPRDQP